MYRTLLVLIFASFWFFSPFYLNLRVAKASPDTEILRPQTHTSSPTNTTNSEYAHDSSGNTTQSDTEYDADAAPAVAFWNWSSAGQTYTVLTLKVEYEAQAGSNDKYQIQYSMDNTGGQCDSTSWTDLISWTSAAASDHTLVSASLSTDQDLTKLCVRLNTDKQTGPDNKHVYIEDIRTEGEYSGALTVDIVDSGGSSVASPSVALSAVNLGFSCQTATATFGVASEKIRVTNTTAGATWTLTLAADSGSTAVWSTGSLYYDFNDGGGSPTGCGDGGDADGYAGQLTIDASGGTITPEGGCSTTGLSLGSSTAFSEGVTDSITLLTAGATADTSCYWDLTGVSISQKIPAEQALGGYSLNMTLTVTAS